MVKLMLSSTRGSKHCLSSYTKSCLDDEYIGSSLGIDNIPMEALSLMCSYLGARKGASLLIET